MPDEMEYAEIVKGADGLFYIRKRTPKEVITASDSYDDADAARQAAEATGLPVMDLSNVQRGEN